MNLSSIFDPQNAFFSTLGRMVDLVVLSLLWLVCCLTILPALPATAALYLTVLRCVRGELGGTYLFFFRTLRSNWKQGLLLTLLLLPFLLGFLTFFPLLAQLGQQGDQVSAIFFYAWQFLFLGAMAYGCVVLALLSRFSMGFLQLLSTAFQLSLLHLPSTLLVGFLCYLSCALCWNWISPVLILPALTALLITFPLERMFRLHAP